MSIDAGTRDKLRRGLYEGPRSDFEEIRVQVPFPCQGKCVWCGTWKKNPWFRSLVDRGIARRILDFYARVVKDEQPQRLMISGGEPLLYPEINAFLKRTAKHVKTIFLYTSYQFSGSDLDHIDTSRLPGDKLVLTHSVVDFLPQNWKKSTQNFPHEQYVENLRRLKEWPGRKIIKFVLNHPHLIEEVELFRRLVEPDDRFHLEAKIMNNQTNNYGRRQIRKSREIIHQNRKYMGISTNNELQLENIIKDRVIENCLHWKIPELRFALYRDQPEIVLKYRFCGYFPPDFSYRVHVDNYKMGMFYKAFSDERFKKACGKCRLLYYRNGDSTERMEPPTVAAGTQ